MTASPVAVRPIRVPVDLSQRSKLQTDAIRMALLLTYGTRRLEVTPDGSSISVELLGSQRSVEVSALVEEVVARFPS